MNTVIESNKTQLTPASTKKQPLNFIKGVSITMITQIFSVFLGITTGVIFNRTLGPEIVGIYATVTVILGVALQLGNLGIQTSTVYYTSNKQIPTPKLVGNVILLGATVGLFLMIITAGLTSIFPKQLLNEIDPIFLYLSILIIPFSLVFDFIRSAFLAKQNVILYNFMDITQHSLNLIGLILILFVFQKGLLEIILFNTILSLFVTITGIIYFQKTHSINYKPDFSIIKKVISYGFVFFISNIAGFLLLRSDIYLINQILDLEQVGIYKIAAGFSDTMLILPAVIASILLPKLCSDTKGRLENSQKAVRVTTLIMFSILLPFAFIAKEVIYLMYGHEFLQAHIPLLVLIPGILFFAMENVMAMYLAAHNFPKAIAFSWVAVTILNIIINLIIIPKIGITGAALSSTISYFLIFFIVLIIYLRRSKSNLTDLFIIKKDDIISIIKAFK